ncbi:hypothetical protein BH09SUM1_BH09SUM1_11190 [soil metagenome]
MNKPVKIAFLLLLLAGALVAMNNLFGKVSEASHGLPPLPTATPVESTRLTPFGKTGPDGNGPVFTAAEREKIADEIGLTAEQKDKIDAIFRANPGETIFDRMKRLQEADKVLTPEQRPIARQVIGAHMGAGMNKRLTEAQKRMGPDDFEAYKRRMQKVRDRLAAGQAAFPGMPTPPEAIQTGPSK